MQKKSKKHDSKSRTLSEEKLSDAASAAGGANRVSDSAGTPYFTVDIGQAPVFGGADTTPTMSDAEMRLYQVQGVAIDLLLKSYNAMIELAAIRHECKLSNTRVAGVAKELRELIKVMSVYEC